MARRYGHDPAVVGWQIDNEIGLESFDVEAKRRWSAWLARRYGPRTHHARERRRHRRDFIGLIFALLLLHVLEIWCYGIAYYWLEHQPDMGFVHGSHAIHTLFDAIYFSASMYTTLGLGDLSPVGAIRLVTGMEAVTGLLLITWSASFTYMEMHQHWAPRDGSN